MAKEIVEINPEEFDAAVNTAKQEVGSYVHKFSAPFEYEGKRYENLTFDFGKLTGNDDIAIENELQAIGKPVIVAEMSGEYLARMAARACSVKIGADIFKAMPLKDFRCIRNKARSFLLRSEL